MATITTLVEIQPIVEFVKARNLPLGTELELTLSDKVMDVYKTIDPATQGALPHFTNDPVEAGIIGTEERPVVASDDVFFLRIMQIESTRVEAYVPFDAKIAAFYVVDFRTLTLSDQTHNLVSK